MQGTYPGNAVIYQKLLLMRLLLIHIPSISSASMSRSFIEAPDPIIRAGTA